MVWDKADKILTLPSGVTDAANTVGKVADTVAQVNRIVANLIEVYAATAGLETDLANAAVKASVKALQAAVKSLADAGIYVLLVPPGRLAPVPPAVQSALAAVGLQALPPAGVPTVVKSAARNANLTQIPWPATFEGGNAGFLRFVLESLNNQTDLNRPQFGPGDYILAHCFLIGGGINAKTLVASVAQLAALLGATPGADRLTKPRFPTPTSLKARFGSSQVFLVWDPPPEIVQDKTGGPSGVLDQILIFRTTDPKAAKVNSYAALVSDDRITQIATIQPAKLQLTETQQVGAFIDDDPTLDPKVTYYYAVAYVYAVNGAVSASDTTLSSFEKARYKKTPVTLDSSGLRGTWQRTTLLSLVPPLGDWIDTVLGYVNYWAQTFGGAASYLGPYAQWLLRQANRLTAKVARLTSLIKAMTALVGGKYPAGVYHREIRGVGGVNYFRGQLVQALLADQDRPPFSVGDEYVAGVVLLTGGPSPASLLPAQNAFAAMIAAANNVRAATQSAYTQYEIAAAQAQRTWGDNLVPAAPVNTDVLLRVNAGSDGSYTTLTQPGAGSTAPTVFTSSTTPKIGPADTGLCPLVKKPTAPAVISFAPNLTPTAG